MKRFLLITFGLLLMVNLTQGRTTDVTKQQVTHEFKGVVNLDGIMISDGRILVDNAYKQHILYKKCKQWADEFYEPGTAMLVDKHTFTVITKDYRLTIKVKDGVFEYIFTDDGKTDQKKEQIVIDELTKYVKTCELKDKSW